MIKTSYDDCPYNCTDGQVFNYELKTFEPCPHCSTRKKELLDKGLAETNSGELQSLPKVLGIENNYLQPNFSYDGVIPEGEKIFLDEDSIKHQKSVLEEIYLGLSVKELPDRSYCVGLGNKGRIDRFAYPLLAKAYMAGLSVAKFISCAEYNRLCINMDSDLDSYYNKDLVIMLIPDGASKADIACAKGLMQTRALKGKPTIFVTTWVIEACSILLGYHGEDTFFMAEEVFVRYKRSKKDKKPTKYISQLTGVENEVYVEDVEVSTPQNSRGANMVSMGDLLK